MIKPVDSLKQIIKILKSKCAVVNLKNEQLLEIHDKKTSYIKPMHGNVAMETVER